MKSLRVRSTAAFETTGTQIGKLYLATSTILFLGFLGFAANTWFEVRQQTEAELENINGFFRNAIESLFQHYEFQLKTLGKRYLELNANDQTERARALIDEFVEVHPHIAKFGLAEPNGQLVLATDIQSGKPLPNLLAQSGSSATFLKVFDTDRLVIGWTYFAPSLKKWLIPLWIAVRDEQGLLKIIPTVELDIDAEQAVWNAIELPGDIKLTLLRKDGFVQLSLPTTWEEREALTYDPLPEDLFTASHEPLDQDPIVPENLAVSSYLLDHTMRIFVSSSKRRIWEKFGGRLVVPTLLFAGAFLLTWILYRKVLHNQRIYEDRIVQQAHRDALTNLPNRLLIIDRLSHDLERAKRHDRLVAVFYIDLDQFKRVNDSYGHQTGDALLKACAERLTGTLRKGDTVGRLGGDEFLLILPDLHSPSDAERLAARVLRSFAAPFLLEGREIYSTASVGISLSPADGVVPDALMQNADTALYKAKDEGRNGYCFYRQELNQEVARRITVDRELRKALERGELHVVYQPRAALESLKWEGSEALIRWQNPLLGSVPPSEFIPIAEEIGLISEIGEFVLVTALRDLKLACGIDPEFNLSVNASTRQFRDYGFVQKTVELLEDAGVRPSLLELEVTESVLANGAEQFAGIREAGIRLAVDDFGTGFSSLSYLKKIPVTTLKIDRSFIKDVENDHADATLTTAIIALAKGMELETVAEGVETEAQLAFLRRQGCNLAQGYLLAKPMPIDDLLGGLERQNRSERDRQPGTEASIP